jgi:hypothetical protein
MTFVRSLVRDLVERRLWPVAVLLVAGLVAVPFVLGGGSEPTAPVDVPVTAPTPNDTPAERAEVTVDESVPAERERAGEVRNPFSAPESERPKAAETTTSASATPSSAGSAATPAAGGSTGTATDTGTPSGGSYGGSSSGGSTSGGSTGSDSGTTTTTPKKATPKTTTTADDAKDTYHVDLRFGVNGAEPKKIEDVARLSPLPSLTDPFFVYLGVIKTKAGEKRAVFLVSSDATPNGEGACHPTTADCESIELAKGQTAYFDYVAPDGTPTQYQLQLTRIRKAEVRTEAKAAAAVARHSIAGAELLRDAAVRDVRAAGGARAYRYVPALGALVRAKRKKDQEAMAVAAAGGATPAARPVSLLPRREQPGLPVWHSPDRGAQG